MMGGHFLRILAQDREVIFVGENAIAAGVCCFLENAQGDEFFHACGDGVVAQREGVGSLPQGDDRVCFNVIEKSPQIVRLAFGDGQLCKVGVVQLRERPDRFGRVDGGF